MAAQTRALGLIPGDCWQERIRTGGLSKSV